MSENDIVRNHNSSSNVRERSVYVQSSMDGYLEKKSSGVLRLKSKVKCWLHGSILYEQKDQDVKFIDLCEAQIVREVTSDPSSTQFEIVIKKKTHTYTCPSSEECKAWVSALQKSMMLKSDRDPRSLSMFYTSDESQIYSTIDEPVAYSSSSNPTLPVISDYSVPCDSVVNTDPPKPHHYEEVDLRTQNGADNLTVEIVDDRFSDSSLYAEVNKAPAADDIDGLELLTTALNDNDFDVDDLPHSLQHEDISCLKILKDCLHANKTLYTPCSLNDADLVNSLDRLKACLSSVKSY